MHEAARNLRTAERFLLAPPLAATFDGAAVAICDISAKGARFRHDKPVDTGIKSMLQIAIEGRSQPLSLEATVVWSHADSTWPGKYISGVRTYGAPELDADAHRAPADFAPHEPDRGAALHRSFLRLCRR